MKKKAKLLAMSLFILLASGIGYSKIATAATACILISGRLYCF